MCDNVTKGIIAEGKTKVIVRCYDNPDEVLVISKDALTAGDGKKRAEIPGKGTWATSTTSNVFRLLEACGIPVAFKERLNPTTFISHLCEMIPCEVVVRRFADGSIVSRLPGLSLGHYFPKLLVEFYLKTKDRKWNGHDLPCEDPLMSYSEIFGEIALFEPSKPIFSQKPFLVLKESEVFTNDARRHVAEMRAIAKRAFLILEKAWEMQECQLRDLKVEFGLTRNGVLRLADVVDNDSWRLLKDGKYICKQCFRNGGDLELVARNYQLVALFTERFRVPRQQLLIWRGSEKDDVSDVSRTLNKLCGVYSDTVRKYLKVTRHTRSVHREPVLAVNELHEILSEYPDTVVVAFVGMSNGAGPTLSAATTASVITVPGSFEDFPNDVWSSLRTASEVPVMTKLGLSDAVLSALGILSRNNPLLYMCLQERVDKRQVNFMPLSSL